MNYGDDKRRLMSAAATMRPLGYAGTGPARSLALLDVAHGYAYGAPPWIWRRGADNEAHCTSSAAFERG